MNDRAKELRIIITQFWANRIKKINLSLFSPDKNEQRLDNPCWTF